MVDKMMSIRHAADFNNSLMFDINTQSSDSATLLAVFPRVPANRLIPLSASRVDQIGLYRTNTLDIG